MSICSSQHAVFTDIGNPIYRIVIISKQSKISKCLFLPFSVPFLFRDCRNLYVFACVNWSFVLYFPKQIFILTESGVSMIKFFFYFLWRWTKSFGIKLLRNVSSEFRSVSNDLEQIWPPEPSSRTTKANGTNGKKVCSVSPTFITSPSDRKPFLLLHGRTTDFLSADLDPAFGFQYLRGFVGSKLNKPRF